MQIWTVFARIWQVLVSLTGRLAAPHVVLHRAQRLPATAACDKGPPGLVGVHRHQPRGHSEGPDAAVRPGCVNAVNAANRRYAFSPRLNAPLPPCLEFLYLCCWSNACASDPPPTDKCGTSRDGLQTFHSRSWVEVLADVHQLLSCCLHSRNQSPRGHLPVHLSRGEADKHILAGGLWWRISADIFSLVGVRKKPPTFSLGCNHGSHWQCWYCSIDVGKEEFIYLLSPLGSYNFKKKTDCFFFKEWCCMSCLL